MEEDREVPMILGRPFLKTDIKGISPLICTHRIRLKAECKPQRQLNPTLKKIVKKEVLKLLDADGYSSYNQIHIAPEDQEKTTFTCPYGTFAFRRMPFDLSNAPATFQSCLQAFNLLKEKLTSTSMIVAPNWELPFGLMCDASDYVVGAVLGQRRDPPIKEKFPDEQLHAVKIQGLPWYADIVNYMVSKITPYGLSS
ncbi:hypothetical protein CRG98_034496 [Punica granatum]|uniref:Reverse transcriptase/retrotransposon-derived protein RNase H-like domain-containing protein n=1 Tax=Punica granatum TaxID=22663 RepID=A0A2I0IM85_PUNGR|nr:hypothetical protein CRG98_034496 [Punica granatum]